MISELGVERCQRIGSFVAAADLGLDSLKVMKLVETVEDRFDISIPLNILPDVRTVSDFVLQIEKISKDG